MRRIFTVVYIRVERTNVTHEVCDLGKAFDGQIGRAARKLEGRVLNAVRTTVSETPEKWFHNHEALDMLVLVLSWT